MENSSTAVVIAIMRGCRDDDDIERQRLNVIRPLRMCQLMPVVFFRESLRVPGSSECPQVSCGAHAREHTYASEVRQEGADK